MKFYDSKQQWKWGFTFTGVALYIDIGPWCLDIGAGLGPKQKRRFQWLRWNDNK